MRTGPTAPLFDEPVDARQALLLAAREACARMLSARHGATKRVYRGEMVAHLRALTSRDAVKAVR